MIKYILLIFCYVFYISLSFAEEVIDTITNIEIEKVLLDKKIQYLDKQKQLIEQEIALEQQKQILERLLHKEASLSFQFTHFLYYNKQTIIELHYSDGLSYYRQKGQTMPYQTEEIIQDITFERIITSHGIYQKNMLYEVKLENPLSSY